MFFINRIQAFIILQSYLSLLVEIFQVYCFFVLFYVENKMCLGNERKEIKPSTSNKGDSQVNREDKVINAMPNNS